MSTAENLTPLVLGITSAAGVADPAIPELLAHAPAQVHDTRVDTGAGVVVVALKPGAVLDGDLAEQLGNGAGGGSLPWPHVPTLGAVVRAEGAVRVTTYRPYAGAAVWAVTFAWPVPGGPEPALDRRTGALTLAGRVVTPHTDRFTVDALRLDGLPATWHPGGGAWATLRLRIDQPDGDHWRAGLAYDGTRLQRVRLHHGRPDDPIDWSGWTEERERERQRFHDAWLAAQPPGRHWLPASWGTVTSSYDGRDGDSSVTVEYT
jgi:hypothetical protein